MREIKEQKLDLPKLFIERNNLPKNTLEKLKSGQKPLDYEEGSVLEDEIGRLKNLIKEQELKETTPYLCLVHEFERGYSLDLAYGRFEDLKFREEIEEKFEDVFNKKFGTGEVKIYYEPIFSHYFIKIAGFNSFTNLPEIFEEHNIKINRDNHDLLDVLDLETDGDFWELPDYKKSEKVASRKCLEIITLIAKQFRLVYYDDEAWFPEYHYRERKPEKVYLKRIGSDWEELK